MTQSITIDIEFTNGGFKVKDKAKRTLLEKFCKTHSKREGKINIRAGLVGSISFDEGSSVEIKRHYPSNLS